MSTFLFQRCVNLHDHIVTRFKGVRKDIDICSNTIKVIVSYKQIVLVIMF